VALFTCEPPHAVLTIAPSPGAPRALVDDVATRVVTPYVFQLLGRQVLHASAVGTPDGGALVLAGARGSGKSTVAASLDRENWPQLADDAVVWHFDERRPVMAPLAFTRRLRPGARALLRTAAGGSVAPDAALRAVRAVVVLEQDDRLATSRLVPVDARAAFVALLGQALVFDEASRHERQRLVRDLLELSAAVPVYRARYPPDLSELADLTSTLRQMAEGAAAHPRG
jgi:hypothetical protein